jgi:hypothetical protein
LNTHRFFGIGLKCHGSIVYEDVNAAKLVLHKVPHLLDARRVVNVELVEVDGASLILELQE